MEENREYDKIPVDYPLLICIFLFMFPAVIFLTASWRNLKESEQIMLPILSGLSIYALWDASQSYRLAKNGIKCYRFGIMTRQIEWSQITQIGIANRGDRLRRGSTPFILIVLRGCEHFDPIWENGHSFCSRNRSSVVVIGRAKYVHLFEKYYGALDFDVRQHS